MQIFNVYDTKYVKNRLLETAVMFSIEFYSCAEVVWTGFTADVANTTLISRESVDNTTGFLSGNRVK